MKTLPLLRFFFSFVVLVPALAQTKNSETEIVRLQNVTVTATTSAPETLRTLATLRAQASQVPGAVTVIGREELGAGRDGRFEDWLRLSPGVALTSDNAADASKISMRGSGIQSDEALGVQVLLDGLVYNQGDGEANLEEIDLASVSAAEVFRGASALRYGGYVLGGAINLVSMTGRDHSGGKIETEAGRFGFLRAHASAGFARGDADVFIAIAARETDGFREHSAEHAEIFSGNFGYRLGTHSENRVYWGLSQWEREIPGDLTLDELSDDPEQADEEALEGNLRVFTRSFRVADKYTRVTDGQRLEIGGFYHYRKFMLYDRYERDYRLGVTDADSDNFGVSLSIEQRGTVLDSPATFTFGLAPAHEVERSENFRNDDGVIDRTRRTASGVTRGLNFPVFAEASVAVTSRTTLVAGAQFVHVDRKFEDRYFTDNEGDASDRQRFRSLNPRFGLVHKTSDDAQLFANVVRSFQPPSFDDLNPFEEGTNGSVVYTPLNAQRAWTIEAGHRGQQGRFEWDVALYRGEGRDELLELNDAAGRDIGTVNAPRTLHQGVEVGLEIELLAPGSENVRSSRLTLRQEYTLGDFRFDGDPVYGRNRIGGLPVHNYEADLRWSHASGVSVGASLQRSFGDYFGDHANTLKVDAYSLVGLHAEYRGPNGLRVFVEMRNLTDRNYVSMAKPIGDARTVDEDEELRIFAPGRPRTLAAGVALVW
ncbi:TonB-dependent receptor family protein [Oleiharenicola lentus]|uniref:TonB-dependent receptor family protein n=1 Tax=Oleiharenicola lentus TaxID=2508720 RepID=UPI003F67B1D6